MSEIHNPFSSNDNYKNQSPICFVSDKYKKYQVIDESKPAICMTEELEKLLFEKFINLKDKKVILYDETHHQKTVTKSLELPSNFDEKLIVDYRLQKIKIEKEAKKKEIEVYNILKSELEEKQKTLPVGIACKSFGFAINRCEYVGFAEYRKSTKEFLRVSIRRVQNGEFIWKKGSIDMEVEFEGMAGNVDYLAMFFKTANLSKHRK